MEMTYQEYIANPMGRKNAVFGQKEMYRAMFQNKLDNIMVRELGKFSYTLYKDTTNDIYVCHCKVPSEVVPLFYYDTVIKFLPPEDGKNKSSLDLYNIQFYSNDPAFVFTFAHAFIENDIFIKDLTPKMSKEAVNKVAIEKNPKNDVGYVKSIYFAYLLMKKHGLFSKSTYMGQAKEYNIKTLLSQIEHADDKVSARQRAQEEIAVIKKKTLAASLVNTIDQRRTVSDKIVSGVKNVIKTNVISQTKKSNNIKNTKTVKRK